MEVGSVLITGANRGIGLELVKQLLKLPVTPKALFAACRSPRDATDLRDLQTNHRNIHIIQIDVSDISTVKSAVQTVEATIGDSGLNLLINNAGIAKRDKVETVQVDQMMDIFKVNAVGPLMVVQSFLPLLRKAVAVSGGKMSVNRSAVINISSGVGSIAENDTGGMYAYRTSKSALNMITKNLSLDLKKDGILVTAVHPGWVKTDMGGANASTETSDCAKTLVNLMSTFISEDFNGKFYHYSGREMQW